MVLLPPQEYPSTVPETLVADEGTDMAETAIRAANMPAHALFTIFFMARLVHSFREQTLSFLIILEPLL